MTASGALRITSGTLRGRRVRSPAGHTTRPLLSRLRKALADILRPRLAHARILDLFGGSGAIGFELLSNGAAAVTFVELDPAAARAIRSNAADLGLAGRVAVLEGDALRVLEGLAERRDRFDLVIVAPPYGKGLQATALEALSRCDVVNPEGEIIVQRDAREALTPETQRFRQKKLRRYGRTVFEFYAPAAPGGGSAACPSDAR